MGLSGEQCYFNIQHGFETNGDLINQLCSDNIAQYKKIVKIIQIYIPYLFVAVQ
jgi:hypothetical protein